MSSTALSEFEHAQNQQIIQNDARRIRERVEAARESPTRSSLRWPLEFVQNAHDSGPRDGSQDVDVAITLREGELAVSHTGRPFTSAELAALLSGGSSKDFDDEETTGRFGTGFLVTHGLSPNVGVDGVLSTQEGNELFHINLVRGGDEDSIVENIEQAKAALRRAEGVCDAWTVAHPTASFTYREVTNDVALTGMEFLQRVLPYLYGTCHRLGQVRIEMSKEVATTFDPQCSLDREWGDLTLRETRIILDEARGSRSLSVVRACLGDSPAGVLAVTEERGSRTHLIVPNTEFPRLFVQFPIIETGFLPFNIVLDGKFRAQQERNGILMSRDDKELISTAMSALPGFVRYGVESGWIDAYRLAQLAVPTKTFSGEGDSSEREWWREVISEVVRRTAAEPIVETRVGWLPALDGVRTDAASFLAASLNRDGVELAIHERIYGMAADVDSLHLPVAGISPKWTEIARLWDESGLSTSRIGVEELADRVRPGSELLGDLPVGGDRVRWLTQLFVLLAEIGREYAVDRICRGLLPDQSGHLRSPGDLSIDEGIDEEVKDIGEDLGLNLRTQLLDKTLWRALGEQEDGSADFIASLCGESITESVAVDGIIERLNEVLPDDSREASDDLLSEGKMSPLRGSARLMSYLVKDGDSQRLRRCPLLTAAGTIIRLAGSRQILAPIQEWPQSAQDYAGLYTKNRVLSDHYCADDKLVQALGPLLAKGLVIPAPLYEAVRPEIADDSLLNAMSLDGQVRTKVTVRNAVFSQIAFLSTDLIQRSGRDPDLARLLLKFAIEVAAREDASWREIREVTGRAGEDSVQMSVRGATWPYELKVRSWVPVPLSEDSTEEGYAPVPANENYLRPLFEPAMLRGNPEGRDLLHEVFGFGRLGLMLEAMDEESQSKLEGFLEDPNLLESAVRNRELLRSVVDDPDLARLICDLSPDEAVEIRMELMERRRRAEARETNRSFGHAVQDALARAVEAQGLSLRLEDRGYDYEVLPGAIDGCLEEASFPFEMGGYFLEVKATTTGDVRLSPLQARTASEAPDRFVLCVVDLQGRELKKAWEPCDVEPYARIVSGIGGKVVDVYNGVDAMTSSHIPVRLRNEEQLRYGLSPDLWQDGVSIDEWVQSLVREETA
ncbi:MAG: hypothetical protein OXG13_01190 [Gemmatimonadaceae bacterium]|nr:hypothetical protein [Gemmatimonadaceae bacterium]